ncbi:adenylyl cyclase CyaB [Salinarchaeum sp. Harcht-Bsk1]|uniref:class IV adenylate cyclase n=1 Tax=Salinarchaeum sp. Harcht-Bsk1 TaxID=1333523 RepID=UPI0003422BBF|nr:class IV adenylate cyclase [Salinarchaeum sp. Harcht-Bsk1]AGN02256.1 adenylyl cyclase CyaB [Salinarchaeum sp. Harcht-Bsk1]
MYEVEVKVAAEHDVVRERLPDDAEALGTVEQVDTYFDAPHRDFAETDEALRLRRERRLHSGSAADEGQPDGDGGWTTELTYKGPLLEAESKSREELETEVLDGEAMEGALDRLGFEPAATVEKQRERYAVGEFIVSLDAVAGLGEFVEVETEIEATDGVDAIDGPRKEALAVLERLGCDPGEQIRTSYLGLLLADDS